MKLTNANCSILTKLDELGENHDADLVQAKQQISNQNADLNSAQEKCNAVLSKHSLHTHCSSECHDEIQSAMREKYELKKAAHPGFAISFDNLDIHLERKNMTMESQNKDFHWVNHQMVENRISGVRLDSSSPKANVLDVCNLKFLPSMEDQNSQRLNYIILCSRILVDYFDVLAPLADACIQHIPHKYTNELSQKTKKVSFRVIRSTHKYKLVFSYIPLPPEEGYMIQFQGTIPRAENCDSLVTNATSWLPKEKVNFEH